jgi:hypothetical protein
MVMILMHNSSVAAQPFATVYGDTRSKIKLTGLKGGPYNPQFLNLTSTSRKTSLLFLLIRESG